MRTAIAALGVLAPPLQMIGIGLEAEWQKIASI
jgi:hypothetical protein